MHPPTLLYRSVGLNPRHSGWFHLTPVLPLPSHILQIFSRIGNRDSPSPCSVNTTSTWLPLTQMQKFLFLISKLIQVTLQNGMLPWSKTPLHRTNSSLYSSSRPRATMPVAISPEPPNLCLFLTEAAQNPFALCFWPTFFSYPSKPEKSCLYSYHSKNTYYIKIC